MKPYIADPDLTIYNGDALTCLRELPDESVHMCVTSPPFFGLRDYQVEGQIGLEQTPDEWATKLTEVFREVRRVLRSDGTLWVECGDSYVSGQGGRQSAVGELPPSTRWDRKGPQDRPGIDAGSWSTGDVGPRFYPGRETNLKPKDLIGQPFLLAFALRADGWYWRNVCIWHKPNPMPESVTDRFTVSHSYVLLFSKSARYFFDAEAVREAWESGRDDMRTKGVRTGTAYLQQGPGAFTNHDGKQTLDGSEGEAPRGPDGRRVTAVKQGDNSIQHRDGERWPNSGRNARSVWTIPTEPLPFEHYAAFPQALVRKAILAGTSERGCCPECGAPWVREVERVDTGERQKMADGWDTGPGAHGSVHREGRSQGQSGIPILRAETVGWHPACECWSKCPPPYPIPATVLDPFLGSGTTALVARKLNRRCVGIELSSDYCALAARRTSQLSLEAEVA